MESESEKSKLQAEALPPMSEKRKLKILFLEDSLEDCLLNLREVRKAGYDPEWKCVESRVEFLSALETFPPDIILSDYSMPQFTATTALELLREKDKVTPFIMISGTVGEEIAVEMLKKGADDYLLKDRLSRLGQSVRKAMEQKELLLEKIRVDAEILRVEKLLQQSQKMEALGTLAGGIAHDFNNILTPIMGYSEMCMKTVEENSKSHYLLEQIHSASMRATQLVGQIMAFSRHKDTDKKPVQVQTVIGEVLKLVRGSIPASVEIVQDVDSDCGAILADPTQVHQILMNLCTNACHAMKEKGGTLTVALKEVSLDRNDSLLLSPGSYLKLEVSDTGTGIDETIIDRIFEPYFTTKMPGEGTGFGLSLVYKIVKDLGGEINVMSRVGEATTFIIHFPLMGNAGTLPA
ncbi:MAG: ATP-binding protein [Victivallales bacterium]|jgi:signal transduction histidine kinase